jgi:hypothetical protein
MCSLGELLTNPVPWPEGGIPLTASSVGADRQPYIQFVETGFVGEESVKLRNPPKSSTKQEYQNLFRRGAILLEFATDRFTFITRMILDSPPFGY